MMVEKFEGEVSWKLYRKTKNLDEPLQKLADKI